MSGGREGAGGIGGLLGRSHGYNAGTGAWATHHFYHADGNGNVTYLVNTSRTLGASYRYDAYGRTTATGTGTLAPSDNVYRFSSKELHAKSGLYYYGYRFYDPNLQRWANRDPIGEPGGINLYAAFLNKPTVVIDPLGRDNIYNPGGGQNAPPVMEFTIPPGGGGASANMTGGDPLLSTYPVGCAALGIAAGVAAECAPALARNLKFDGPKPNYKDPRTGRICQIRWGTKPLLRLDYHAIPGSHGKPVLHLNVGPGEGKNSIHIPLWPPRN